MSASPGAAKASGGGRARRRRVTALEMFYLRAERQPLESKTSSWAWSKFQRTPPGRWTRRAGADDPARRPARAHQRQNHYLSAIQNHDITFGIGPAGTGKTYLAVASAVDAMERDAVKRIVLVRPAVEAGEKLGFLPGDLAQKVDPYLRPLYDALYDLMGFDRVSKLFEKT